MYAEIYNMQFYDKKGSLNTIEILEYEYSGSSTQLLYSAETPLIFKSISEDKDSFDSTVIQGTEISFSFYIPQSEVNAFNSIFEADYRQYQVIYRVAGVLEFQGWIKAENLSKQYDINPPFVLINLSATDALADLKDFEFRDSSNSLILGKKTLLEILQYAISKTGIELNFAIHLNTREINGMSSTDCALNKIYVDSRRFIGKIGVKTVTKKILGFKFSYPTGLVYSEIMSCWDVIESVLRPFNCKLKQSRGYYYIINYYEHYESFRFIYQVPSLTLIGNELIDNHEDLSNFKFKVNIEQQKISPLKEVNVTFRNKDIGGDVTGADLSDWDTVWDIHFSSYTVASGVVRLVSNSNEDYMILESDFSVSKVTDNDYLKISFDTSSPNTYGFMDLSHLFGWISIKRPDGSWSKSVIFNKGVSGDFIHVETNMDATLKIPETGLYNVKITIPNSLTNEITYIKNVEISKTINATNVQLTEAVTFDHLFKQTSSKGFKILEQDVLFGDSVQTSEVGAFLYFDTVYVNTSSWRTFLHSEDIKILDIYSRNILNNRYTYKNYLKLSIYDPQRYIYPIHVVSLNTGLENKIYAFLSYNRNEKTGMIDAELVELLHTQNSFNIFKDTVLDSVNGESIHSINVDTVSENYLIRTGDTASGSYTFDTNTFKIDAVNHRVGMGLSPTHRVSIAGTTDECSLLVGEGVASGLVYMALGHGSSNNEALWMGYDYTNNYGGFCIGGDVFGTSLNIASGGKIGIGTAASTMRLKVDGSGYFTEGVSAGNSNVTTGIINAQTGFRINNAATSGHILKGNGTNYVDSDVAALTKTDDTNVTLTLGGSPSTALINAASLTLGWTGTLSVSRGGIGAGTLTSNGVLYGNGTGAVQATAQGGSNTILVANGGTPSFSASPTIGTSITTPTIKLTASPTVGYVWLCTNSDGSGAWTTFTASQVYKGTWNASTNTPTLADGSGTQGWWYRCVVAGTVDFGSGNITFAVGDDVSYNGSIWEKIPGVGYTLQIASASVLGGVKIGTGLNIDGSGILSIPWTISGNDIYNNNSGNVGIGTTSPAEKFHIHGGNILFSGPNSANASEGFIKFYNPSYTSQFAGIQALTKSDASDQLYLVFFTSGVTGTPGERLRIDQNGNIGIGTTSPGSILDVKGTIRLSGATSGYVGFSPAAAAGSTTYTLPFTAPGDGQILQSNDSAELSWVDFDYPQAGIALSTGSGWTTSITNNSNNWNDAYSHKTTMDALTGLLKGAGGIYSAVTDNSSNWNTAYGWGNHASAGYFVKASDDLDDITAGSINVHLTTSLKTNYDAAYTHSQDNTQAHSDYLINNGNDSTSGTLTASNFILSSDERLKVNICDFKVKEPSIHYKSFELKSELGQTRYGVIAQDLIKTNPDLLRYDENGFMSVAYIDLFVQEIVYLKAKIKELEAKL